MAAKLVPHYQEEAKKREQEAGEAFGVSGKQVDKATKVLAQGAKPLVEACDCVLGAMAPRRPSPDLLSLYMTVFRKFRICCRTPGSTRPLKTSRK